MVDAASFRELLDVLITGIAVLLCMVIACPLVELQRNAFPR
ncbi:hypothetical protein [Bradyrhizobium sp. NAS80.1]|nr:hypothetical protein [Bradyrhizobium sp. NAS80.1]